ncbi:hypothetical protein IG631_15849 [Alternaria alternata]|nr:hypothetical protein IG631_15849 [Alternaria alternata]
MQQPPQHTQRYTTLISVQTLLPLIIARLDPWPYIRLQHLLTMSIAAGQSRNALLRHNFFSRLLASISHVDSPTVTDVCLPSGMRFVRASPTCTVGTHPSLLVWTRWVVCMPACAP